MKVSFTRKTRRTTGVIGALVLAGVLLAACTGTTSDSAQQKAQGTSEQIAAAAAQAVPFPINQIKAEGWTERKELAEHAIRENDPHTTRYGALIDAAGQVIQTWTIEGTVFSQDSQLTNTQNQDYGYSSANGGSFFDGVVDSPGDNGTWGPEAFCYDFFTTQGREVQLACSASTTFEVSDSPFNVKEAPSLTINENVSGVKDNGQLAGIGGH